MKRDFNLSMGSRRPWLPGFGEDNVGEWVRAGLLSVDHAIGIVAQQPPIPLPSDSYKFLRWPWSRRAGMSFLVKEYHFLAELADRDLNQYEVSITPETSSRVVLCAVMEELARLHMASYLGGRISGYDGGKAMYTVGALPFTSKEFLLDEDDGSS